MNTDEFRSNISGLLPVVDTAAMDKWLKYAEEMAALVPREEMLGEVYGAFSLVNQHYGSAIAATLFDLGATFCLHPHELSAAARLLRLGVPVQEITELSMEGRMDSDGRDSQARSADPVPTQPDPPAADTLETKLYSPVNFYMRYRDAEHENRYDNSYWRDEVSHWEASDYLDEMLECISNDPDFAPNSRGLAEYLDKGPLYDKVQSLIPTIELHGDKLWTVAHLRLNEPLTPDELSELKDYWEGQLSDGWGEGLEQQEIVVDEGALYIEPWSAEREFFIDTQMDFDRRMGIERPAPPVEAPRQSPEPTLDLKERRETLFSRLDKNLSDYCMGLLDTDKQELIGMAEEIAARFGVRDYLQRSHNFRSVEIDFLLQYDNPLEVICDHTPPTFALLELSGAISELANMEGALRREYAPARTAADILADADAQDNALAEIARKHCHVETLETRKSDRLDFHDVSVWGLKAALQEAFDAGVAHQMAKEATVELPEPDAPTVDEQALKKALDERLDKNFAHLMADLHEEITVPVITHKHMTGLAEQIAATSAARDYLKEHNFLPVETMQFLLQFDNPLELVAEHWPVAKDDLLDFSTVLEDVMDHAHSLDPLAGEPAAPEPPREQPASGKPSLLAELREAKARSEQQNTTPPTNKSEPER